MSVAQLCVTDQLASLGPQARARGACSPSAAAEYCRRFAHGHYENFTVACRLLPGELRRHFFAVYAYCRWADDLADETRHPERSLVLLDWWHEELRRCYRGQAEHPVFVALSETIDSFEIPPEPFERLLAAFRQDQHQTRYPTHEAVLAYCQNSATPVGRLILYLGRCHDERRGALADSICTGLQLANFCQDVQRDWAAGRVYLPHATLDEAGCFDEEPVWGQPTPAFRKALAREVERAEGYLRGGAPLVEMVPPVLRVQVALFVAGGLAVLSAIRRRGFDVWTARPTVGRWRKAQLLAQCWWQYRLGGRKEASS